MIKTDRQRQDEMDRAFLVATRTMLLPIAKRAAAALQLMRDARRMPVDHQAACPVYRESWPDVTTCCETGRQINEEAAALYHLATVNDVLRDLDNAIDAGWLSLPLPPDAAHPWRVALPSDGAPGDAVQPEPDAVETCLWRERLAAEVADTAEEAGLVCTGGPVMNGEPAGQA